MENIKNKTLAVADIYGNVICSIVVDDNGNITDYGNCEIIDIYSNGIKVQAVE